MQKIYSSFPLLSLLSVVLFACFILSISAAFEYQLESREYQTDEMCNNSRSQADADGVDDVRISRDEVPRLGDDNNQLTSQEKEDIASFDFNEDVLHHRLVRSSYRNDESLSNINSENDDSFNYSKLSRKTSNNPADVGHYVNDAERDNVTARDISQRNHNTCSTVSDFTAISQKGLLANVIRDNKTLRSCSFFFSLTQ